MNNKNQIILSVIGLILGLLFIFIPETIINYVFLLLGILLIIQAIPSLAFTISAGLKNKESIISFSISLITLILGIVLITSGNMIISVIAGVILIALPLYRIASAIDKTNQCKKELPLIIFGLVLIILGPGKTFSLILQIVGGIICIISLYNLVISLIAIFKEKRQEKKDKDDSEVIDV